ncbi:hypothetical protein INR49_022984 [Caranx melampygus]|nr:hypothetical protein INR49_022984 [Caranx melampygus]
MHAWLASQGVLIVVLYDPLICSFAIYSTSICRQFSLVFETREQRGNGQTLESTSKSRTRSNSCPCNRPKAGTGFRAEPRSQDGDRHWQRKYG